VPGLPLVFGTSGIATSVDRLDDSGFRAMGAAISALASVPGPRPTGSADSEAVATPERLERDGKCLVRLQRKPITVRSWMQVRRNSLRASVTPELRAAPGPHPIVPRVGERGAMTRVTLSLSCKVLCVLVPCGTGFSLPGSIPGRDNDPYRIGSTWNAQ
jgi:hypothetical protein